MSVQQKPQVHNPRYLYLDSPIGRGPGLDWIRRRAFLCWLLAPLSGVVLSLANLSPALNALGLGLVFPGGGFLYTATPHWFVLSVILYVVSLAGWFIMGGFIYPFIAWGGAAVLSMLEAHGTLWPWAEYAVPVLTILVILNHHLSEKKANKAAIPVAEALKQHLESTPFVEPSKDPIVGEELSDQELGALRYILDLSMQPVHEFRGFVTKDQFREAAWRYQLVSINYALAMLQSCRTPAFHGYQHEAARRATEKMRDRRNWKYWRLENFVGNLKLEADPVKRDNIMYHGWWGMALGAYERTTGDLQFSQPGALTLHENKTKSYVYDYTSMMEAAARNSDASPLCVLPCEPNWVFGICTLYGMAGMLLHDRVHGSHFGIDRLDKFIQAMESEFTTADGKQVAFLSNRGGFILNGDSPSFFNALTTMMNMISPRLAQVYWETAKFHADRKFKNDCTAWGPGKNEMLDAGNYEMNGVSYWSYWMAAAKEMGDMEIYNFARAKYEQLGIEDHDGALHWKGSVLNQLVSHGARFATPGAWNRLAFGEMPAAIHQGPILKDASYPEVLVAAANNDGTKLDLVLCSAKEDGVRELKLARLVAGKRYRIQSTEANGNGLNFNADAGGNAKVSVTVANRTRISVVPEA
jgi:hypothetical protein